MSDYTLFDNANSIPEFPKLPPEVRYPIGSGKNLCPLLDEIISFIGTWAPESFPGFYEAAAISLLSIVSARRVMYELGGTRTTSLYIALVGRSGLAAKSTVIKIVDEIIRQAGLSMLLLPDSGSAQKFISEMAIRLPEPFEINDDAKKESFKNNFVKENAFSGQRGWVYDEMGKLFREMMQNDHANSTFRDIIRLFDDNKAEYKNATQIRGLETVYFPFISILGGLTPADLAPYAKKGTSLWNDGFLARWAIICAPIDFIENCPFPDGNRIVPSSIIQEIKNWHFRLGCPTLEFTPDAKITPAKGHTLRLSSAVKSAFYEYRIALKDISLTLNEPDLESNYIRFPEKAMRIAAVLASVNKVNEITIEYWEYAQTITERWRESLHGAYYQIVGREKTKNPSSTVSAEDKVYNIILIKGPITAREIKQQTALKTDFIAEIIQGLLERRRIMAVEQGRTIYYQVTND